MAEGDPQKRFGVLFEQEPSGWWKVTVDEFPGFATIGSDIFEAWEKLGESVALWIQQEGIDMDEIGDPARYS